MERDGTFLILCYYYGNFNSHAHVERDKIIGRNAKVISISTHTLTWSVTNARPAISGTGKISTHTLTWSVTISFLICLVFFCISTHTLTWSVTGNG